MQNTAPLRLLRLQRDHAVAGMDNTYDGIAMWKALLVLSKSTGLHEERVDHDRAVEALRDDTLPDGCCVDEFTEKVNDIVRNHAPYLERPFADDESLARFIIRLMPAANAAEGRSIFRRLEEDKTLDSKSAISECVRVVKEFQSAEVRRVVASAARSSSSSRARSLALQSQAAAAKAAAEAAVAAAAAAYAGGRLGGKPSGRQNGPPGPTNGGAHLGDDRWCKEGTCHFDHEGPCWRSPSFKGDEKVTSRFRTHRRGTHGTGLGVTPNGSNG